MRVMAEELNRLYQALRGPAVVNWPAAGTVEYELLEGVERIKGKVSERDRMLDRAIAAVHRARIRHPNELAKMPWIEE